MKIQSASGSMKNTRREFLRKATTGGLMVGISPSILANEEPKIIPTGTYGDVAANPVQKAWMELKFGMFIHFGINTYYDREWSEGDLDISVFNPDQLDTDEWCRIAKKAGMKYIVIGAKHHDGFCLWPSRQTNYSVANTPFNGDILARLSLSAEKHGLRFGLYYSLWDRNNKLHDSDENDYISFVKNQLKELLSNYGPIVELWFDGFWKKQQSGWKTPDGSSSEPEEFIRSWRMEGAYRWQIDHLYQYVKSLQPECIVMNNATTEYPGVPLHPVDATCGERALQQKNYRKVWPWLGKEKYFPMQIETTMSTKGNDKFPSGNWFWHEWDHSVASVDQIKSWLATAAAMDANLLLNCGPMSNGLLRPEDIKILSSLRKSTHAKVSELP